jgi:hypothetical protein
MVKQRQSERKQAGRDVVRVPARRSAMPPHAVALPSAFELRAAPRGRSFPRPRALRLP